jgi:hypothetical protein
LLWADFLDDKKETKGRKKKMKLAEMELNREIAARLGSGGAVTTNTRTEQKGEI